MAFETVQMVICSATAIARVGVIFDLDEIIDAQHPSAMLMGQLTMSSPLLVLCC